MRNYHFTLILLFLFCIGCDYAVYPEINARGKNYDVILVIGQSNTLAGLGYNKELDSGHPSIHQLGRFDPYNLKPLPANEPLAHHTPFPDRIGFALSFANLYVDEYLEADREVLILPCGFGGTGFQQNNWNKGDPLYQDALFRVRFALDNFPNSDLKAILWHQGESDVGNTSYQANLDSMIQNLRSDINLDSIPFILGGMVPFWVDQDPLRITQENIISQTVSRMPFCGFADPRVPSLITKEDDNFDEIHFDAAGLREMGKRYFEAFKKLIE